MKSTLHCHTLDEFAHNTGVPMEIKSVSTDNLTRGNQTILKGPWYYNDSAKVFIEYLVQDLHRKIIFDNLITHGFSPRSHLSGFRYYSFLTFKEFCGKLKKSYEEVSN